MPTESSEAVVHPSSSVRGTRYRTAGLRRGLRRSGTADRRAYTAVASGESDEQRRTHQVNSESGAHTLPPMAAMTVWRAVSRCGDAEL